MFFIIYRRKSLPYWCKVPIAHPEADCVFDFIVFCYKEEIPPPKCCIGSVMRLWNRIWIPSDVEKDKGIEVLFVVRELPLPWKRRFIDWKRCLIFCCCWICRWQLQIRLGLCQNQLLCLSVAVRTTAVNAKRLSNT